MTATSDLIQKLYIGYFGRAGDPSGLQYWVERKTAGMGDAAIAQSFSVQTEATNMYGYLAAPSLGMGQDAFLESVYQNLFERSIEAGGLTYWKGQLNAGRPVGSIILDIINGAQGSDATTVANKLSVANYYTEKVISANATWTLADDQADAISVIANVTSDTATVTTGRALADTLVAADTAAPPQTFTLTTASNTGSAFTGGSGNDTFDGSLNSSNQQTLNSGDQLNGGNGTDSLNATINASVTPAALTSIENVTVSVVTNASTLDLTNATGLSSVTSSGSTAATTLRGFGTSVAVELRDSAVAQTITYSGVSGSADSATVSVNNMSQATGVATTIAGIETLTLNATGADATLGLLTTANTSRLNVTGSKALTVVDNLGSTIITFDASANTGGVNVDFDAAAVTVTGGSGNDDFSFEAAGAVSVAGGAGNDTIRFDAVGTYTTADSVAGGDGTDTLSATAAALVTASATTPTTYKTTGIEKLSLNTALADGATLNAANIDTSINRIEVTAISAAAGALDETYVFNAGASTLELDAAISGDGAQIVSVGGSATTDSLTIINGTTSATNVLNGMALTTRGFETVTINTTGTGAAGDQTVGAIGFTASAGGTPSLVVTGSNKLTTGVISAASGSIDASGMSVSVGTAGLDMITGANSANTITGSAGDDDLWGSITSARNQTISGGAGNDTITAGGGNDSLLGGADADTIDGGAGNDYIDGGAGNDRVLMTTDGDINGNDTIIGGDGTDTLVLSHVMTTNTAAEFQNISGFEVFEYASTGTETLEMSDFVGSTFTRIDFGQGGNGTLTANNVGSAVTEVRFLTGFAADTGVFDRLADTSTNSLNISGRAAITVTAFTADDEETISLSGSTATNDFVVTTLTASDLKTLNVTGDADVTLTSVASATNLATVNLSSSTGANTLGLLSSATNITLTAGTGVTKVGTGTGTDSITGGSSADILAGNAGADTINGGAGADTIFGGAGNDNLTGGSGSDVFLFGTVATADTYLAVSTTNGVDTITDFAVGSDDIDVTGALNLIDTADPVGFLTVATVAENLTAASGQSALVDDRVYILNTSGAAASITTGGTAELVQADFTASTLTNVAAFLTEQFTAAAGDDNVFVINWTGGGNTLSYVYDFTETGAAATIVAAELTLVGIITRTTTDLITTADII